MTVVKTGADQANRNQFKVEEFFSAYIRLLDDFRYSNWLELFAEDAFYGAIRYDDHKKDNSFFIVADTKAKLAVRLKLGADTDARMRVHVISGMRVDEVASDGTVTASSNFAVFCDNALLYAGQYHMTVAVGEGCSTQIKRCVVVITNDQPNALFYLPI